MLKFLLFTILLIGLQASCNNPGSTGSQAEGNKSDPSGVGNGNAITPKVRDFEGCWIGSNRGAIELGSEHVSALTDNATVQKYAYKTLVHAGLSAFEVLIEVESDPNIFCVERFNLIRIENRDEIYVENYNSLEDVKNKRPDGFCSLVRVSCR